MAELIELFFGGRNADPVLQVFQQDLQFGNFAPPPVRVGREQNGQNQHAGRDGAQVIGNVLQALPQQHGQGHREQHHKPEGEAPQPVFFLFQVARGPLRTWGLVLFRSHI